MLSHIRLRGSTTWRQKAFNVDRAVRRYREVERAQAPPPIGVIVAFIAVTSYELRRERSALICTSRSGPDVELPDKLGLVYPPPVLVDSEVQLLVGLDLLPWAEANKGAFLERFPDRMTIHYVGCFECVH